MKYFKILLALGIFLILCSISWADIPNMINFQGILDSAGNPLANKTKSVEFKIYNALVGGTAYWSETQSVTTNAGGVFNVLLGDSNPIPDSVFDDTVRYLGIKVGTDAEMSPRQQIVSNAYGYRVSTVDGATGGNISGDVDIQSDLTVLGKVGVGTTTPTADLHIVSTQPSARMILESSVSNGNPTILVKANTPAGCAAFFADRADAGCFASFTLLTAGSTNWNLYVPPGSDRFDITTATTPRFTILQDGRVGIGTTSPAAKLEIQSPLTTEAGLIVRMTNSGGWVPARFINSNSGQTIVEVIRDYGTTLTDIDRMALAVNSAEASIYTDKIGVGVARPITFKPAGAEAMRIAVDGKVGIGTTSPSAKLDVTNGYIRARDNGTNNTPTSGKGLELIATGSVGDIICYDRDLGIYLPLVLAASSLDLQIEGVGTTLYLNSSGNVGIGTTSPSEKLHVVGNICATGTIGACSDLRYKTNLKTVSNALEKVINLKGIYFNWKKDQYPDLNFEDDRQIGFVAQELKEIFPEVVSQGKDGYYSVDYGKLTPLLVEAIKEQQKTIQSLEEKLEKLEKKFSRFTSQTSGSEELGYREEE